MRTFFYDWLPEDRNWKGLKINNWALNKKVRTRQTICCPERRNNTFYLKRTGQKGRDMGRCWLWTGWFWKSVWLSEQGNKDLAEKQIWKWGREGESWRRGQQWLEEGKVDQERLNMKLFGWQRSPSRVRTKKPRWDPSWEQLRGAGGCVPVRKESQQALNGKWEPIHQSEKVQGILWRSKKSRKYSLKSKQVHGSERSQKRHKEGRNKWLR